MDYKTTLNLPKTSFSMKADLPRHEPQIIKLWEKIDIYHLLREEAKGKPKYVLHDGPPYANGDIHIGHALNKILKDIIVKYNTMQGKDSPFVPGWDCHGLPVEHQLFKELGINKNDIEQITFRKKAYNFAMNFVEIQREQFKRLGVFGDWENPYLTLDYKYEAEIIRTFKELVKRGFIYKARMPVNWCYTCETALAEAEVEYQDHASPSIYVKFKVVSQFNRLTNPYLVIWTTTPWTLIANVAVAVHPELKYVAVDTDKGIFIIAQDLLTQTLQVIETKDKELKVLGYFKGKELEGLEYKHSFIERKGRVVLADYVSNQEGTGCVHIAPGHGQEDYLTGLKYKLPLIMPVNSKGKFDSTAEEFSGMNVYDSNQRIIAKLKENGDLLYSGNLTHSYPHCWRCKKPIIFRATEQWFMKIDHNFLRSNILGAIESKVTWWPPQGKERIYSMVEKRPDWCLSRQRYWGVPIPAFYCNRCNEYLLDTGIIERFAKLVEKEGSDAWFLRDIEELIPKGTECKCGSKEFRKETDILDVWFDSGVSYRAVLMQRKDELSFPADLYLEGSDQHRGWFQSAIIPAMAIEGKPPYKKVFTHGFVVDGEGRKMSKSLENVISPQEVIKDLGADTLRLWAATCDYTEDVRISKEILNRLTESYRKIRNTCRFILANLYDFNPNYDIIPYEEMLEIDKWILYILAESFSRIIQRFQQNSFYMACQYIYHFCTADLSNRYLDILKYRLYTFKADSKGRRSAQTAMYEILNLLVKLIAPILPFTAEEIWQCIPKRENENIESVHLTLWPSKKEIVDKWGGNKFPPSLADKWGKLMFQVRPDVSKALEKKRELGEIGDSSEAGIQLWVKDGELFSLLKEFEGDLPSIFIVSEVNIKKVDILPEDSFVTSFPNLAISCQKALGLKCERCWNYNQTVSKDSKHPTLCARCVQVLSKP